MKRLYYDERERPELTPSEDARELERQLRDASDAPWETDPQDIVAILTAFKERILREAIEGMRVIYERAVAKYITGEGLDLDWHEIEAAIMSERSKAMSINETRGEPDIVMGALSPASPPESAAKGEEHDSGCGCDSCRDIDAFDVAGFLGAASASSAPSEPEQVAAAEKWEREWAENCGGMALPPPSEPSGDDFRHRMVMAFQEIRRTRSDEGMSEWTDDDMANWVLANMPAARPSREEEMREALNRIIAIGNRVGTDRENLVFALKIARAALAQDGARDEGEGKR